MQESTQAMQERHGKERREMAGGSRQAPGGSDKA